MLPDVARRQDQVAPELALDSKVPLVRNSPVERLGPRA